MMDSKAYREDLDDERDVTPQALCARRTAIVRTVHSLNCRFNSRRANAMCFVEAPPATTSPPMAPQAKTMSSPSAVPEPTSEPVPAPPVERVKFPNAVARPAVHTLYGWFRRHLVLFTLYLVWVVGLISMTGMWLVSLVYVARTALSLGTVPVPLFVQFYVAVMVLYYSSHYVLFYAKPQGMWQSARTFVRRSLLEYPYFRHMICIFEDHEKECLQDPLKPMVSADARSMFAFHPHGVLSSGFAYNGCHSTRFQESKARWLIAENMFWYPVMRDMLHWQGFEDVNKATFVHHMSKNRNVCLIPGGFEEATIYERSKHRAYIKKRFGFVKLALQYGYKLHAAYTFGEEETFHAFPYFLTQRLKLNTWKIPGVVFYGRLLCFFLPREDVELTTVVSKPIEMPRIANPTKEDVAKYHQLYVDTLVGLFERHKHKYAKDPTATLELF